MTTTIPEVYATRDAASGDYTLRIAYEIRIPGEIYQRTWYNAAVEEAIDLSDPVALSTHTRKVGKAERWWDHPKVTKTLLPLPGSSPESEQGKQLPVSVHQARSIVIKGHKPEKTVKQEREDRLREAAYRVPPSQWMDVCRTPIPGEKVTGDARRKVLRERTEERYVLEWLLDEWKAGRFQISEEAQAKEQTSQFPSAERLELVASMVNSNGFH